MEAVKESAEPIYTSHTLVLSKTVSDLFRNNSNNLSLSDKIRAAYQPESTHHLLSHFLNPLSLFSSSINLQLYKHCHNGNLMSPWLIGSDLRCLNNLVTLKGETQQAP